MQNIRTVEVSYLKLQTNLYYLLEYFVIPSSHSCISVPNRLCSCSCHLHIKPKLMLLQRQTEIRLYLIKSNLAKYIFVPVYFQKVLRPDFKNGKVQLIIQNSPPSANLCNFPTTSLCQTVLGTSKETGQDTKALENSVHISECLLKRRLKGKLNCHFLLCIFCLAALQSIFFLVSLISCWQGQRPALGIAPPFLSALFRLPTWVLPMVSSPLCVGKPSTSPTTRYLEREGDVWERGFPAKLLTSVTAVEGVTVQILLESE